MIKRSYLISAGDSSRGPIGFCVRVKAYSAEEALEKVKAALPESVENVEPYGDEEQNRDIEYINVYFNDAALTISEVVDSETDNICSKCDQPFLNEEPDEEVCPDCSGDSD